MALMEITSKNYQGILEFKLSNHAGRLSPSDTDIISQNPKNDKGENSDYYTDKKKVDAFSNHTKELSLLKKYKRSSRLISLARQAMSWVPNLTAVRRPL